MHDRRIDGKTHTFGNWGGLYKNAMTWFDHETNSVWSQPLGTALRGPYKGVQLEIVPAAVMPWATWKDEHPETEVLAVATRTQEYGASPFTGFHGQYVLGVFLDGEARAYPFTAVAESVVVNDRVGDVPVLVYANPKDGAAHIFVRRAAGDTLEFEWADGQVRDRRTGSDWDPVTGQAVKGELAGARLDEAAYSTAYDWAWVDFYPDTTFYGAE